MSEVNMKKEKNESVVKMTDEEKLIRDKQVFRSSCTLYIVISMMFVINIIGIFSELPLKIYDIIGLIGIVIAVPVMIWSYFAMKKNIKLSEQALTNKSDERSGVE
jgi:uncharacterized membrane protein YkvI